MKKAFAALLAIVMSVCLMLSCVAASEAFSSGYDMVQCIKASYWSDYPPNEGYPNFGKAMNSFFDKPNWHGVDYGGGNIKVVFTGIAQCDGRLAKYEIEFYDRGEGQYGFRYIKANGRTLYDPEAGDSPSANMSRALGVDIPYYNTLTVKDFLAAIYLNN